MPSAAQTEINTELAQKLKKVLEAAKKRRFTPSPALKKHMRKKEGNAATKEHVDSNARPKAVLGKNSIYQENGTRYLREHDGRGVYRNFSHEHLKKIRKLVRSVAEFPEGPPQNFDRKAPSAKGKASGAKWPYAWEAHHLIPGDVFTHMKAGTRGKSEPIFTPEQYKLLTKSEYDVNNGHNIIMLPAENWAVPIHVLLQHPSDHPEYTKMVLMQCQSISEKLQSHVAKNNKKHKENLEKAIVQELHDLEEDLWDFIVSLSQRVVDAVIEGQEFDESEPVRFSKKDGSPYQWGALY